jgi:hypothetical protein
MTASMKTTLSLLFFLSGILAQAQYKQQIRGTVVDMVLQKPLPGATVALPSLQLITTTDEEGLFRFKELPIGSYPVSITYTGFKPVSLENIIISSGKETVLTISMEALVKIENEVVVTANSKRNKPLNDMSAVSARAFTVEETQRYAAAVNDPLRMAAAFPGVLAVDDGGNSIIIRGNSPTGLLWKMEGMDIPNPNHFSQAGNTGGGISILSAQLLANSDFVTAAFAAEYGNALSGVFDLKLRRGNNEKREYTLQAGVLGLDAALEGPFSKKYKGSYLVDYRYSTLTLLNAVGVLPSGGSVTNFQDLSYNFYLPTKKLGNFTVFGFGGLSNDNRDIEKDSTAWKEKSDRYPYRFISNTSMTGVTHTILLGSRINLRTSAGISYTKNGYDEDYIENDYSISKNHSNNYIVRKWLFNSTMNYRFSNRLQLRAGFIGNLIYFNYYRLSAEHEGEPLEERINTKGNTATQQVFAQLQYKASNDITVNAGMHWLQLSLNNSSALEPRVSAKWNITNKTSLSVGYGLHSQLQIWGVYFARQKNADGSYSMPNKELGFTRSNHYVVSLSHRLAKNMLLKTELYYQQLFNVPVSTKDSSTFSTLNIIDGYVLDPMVNKGTGRNYGIEVSLERYLHNNVYFMLSNSIYQSKYTALDGIERNTRFNGNYTVTLIGGKDFVSANKRKTFGVNIKTIYAGGLKTTPVDFAQSQSKGYTVFDEYHANTLTNPNYFRADLRLSIKWNRKNFTSTLSLDIQNLTNRLNVYNQYYNDETNAIEYNYQTGMIPILNYKIEF